MDLTCYCSPTPEYSDAFLKHISRVPPCETGNEAVTRCRIDRVQNLLVDDSREETCFGNTQSDTTANEVGVTAQFGIQDIPTERLRESG